MKSEDLLKRADELIEMANAVLQTEYHVQHKGTYVDFGLFQGFRSASLSFLQQTFGVNHAYYKGFDTAVKTHGLGNASAGQNILRAAKAEIAGGWLFTVKGLASAEIFTDFIGRAEYLLSEGYKDAAAVIIGSVLEEHLRQLCEKHDIPVERKKGDKVVPKKADTLNADLTKAGVYNKLEMKNVLGWLDLRNKAAHGKYNEYAKEQVKLMLRGVMDFITRISI